jgi:protein-S-isoprenylcysteine O-methyltransferase Ste14
LLAMIIFAQPTAVTMAIGFVVVAAGEFIRFWGVAYAGSLTRVTGSVGAPEVIVAGPFARVRNPLYVGNVLTYVGIGIMSNALFPWLVVIAAMWFGFQYYQIVMLEESFLEKEFGAAYLDFKRNVPRFLPRLSEYVNPVQSKQLSNWKEATRSERRTFQALSFVLLILLVLWYAR